MINRIWRSTVGRIRATRAVMSAKRSTSANLDAMTNRDVTRILVVCYGNIYRSAFLGAYLKQQAKPSVEIRSTGFHQKINRPSPERHIAMSREHGVDLSAHRSSLISQDDIAWADLIVIMDRHNWQALSRMAMSDTAVDRKLVWAGVLGQGTAEIRDPYQMTDANAAKTLKRLEDAGRALLQRLSLAR